MSYTVTLADILEWAKTYTGEPYHASFCDAPYHLTELNKRFSAQDAAPAQYGTDGAFQRASRGFMGKDWDGGDIAFRPETWAAIARHIHPGGFVVSFAGSRGWHRMAVAMEGMAAIPARQLQTWADVLALARETKDWGLVESVEGAMRAYLGQAEAMSQAGLLIHPTIFCWAYGSGFPKATRIDAQIDAGAFRAWLKQHPAESAELRAHAADYRAARRAGSGVAHAKAALDSLQRQLKQRAGLAPRVVGEKKHAPKFAAAELGYREKDNGFNSRERETFELTESATDLGRDWAGHRYGGQALKPAVEPIIVAQVPYTGRPVDCITRTGAGAFNIDGARIGTGGQRQWTRPRGMGFSGGTDNGPCEATESDQGRWPANLVLSHSPACNGTCAPDCPVRRLGEQSGEGASKASNRGLQVSGAHGGLVQGTGRIAEGTDSIRGHDDSGTAARYFLNADWMYERLEAADPVGYYAKASAAEREAGLDDMQVRLMQELYGDDEDGDLFDETTVDDGRDTPIDNPYQRGETTRRNTHPTIKPIALNRWLATLLLPPARYAERRLLVPFAGAGSEVIGAMLAGWEVVEGIELEAEHVRIAQARIAFWSQMRYRLMRPDAPVKLRAAKPVPAGQTEMF